MVRIGRYYFRKECFHIQMYTGLVQTDENFCPLLLKVIRRNKAGRVICDDYFHEKRVPTGRLMMQAPAGYCRLLMRSIETGNLPTFDESTLV